MLSRLFWPWGGGGVRTPRGPRAFRGPARVCAGPSTRRWDLRAGRVPAPRAAPGTRLPRCQLWWGARGEGRGVLRWSWVLPAPPRAAASPLPPRPAHRAALPRQRQLLHAAIYSEGHLLLSVVAKPSKDCMPRKNSSEVTGLAAAVPKAACLGTLPSPRGGREDAPWVTAPGLASLQGTQAGG